MRFFFFRQTAAAARIKALNEIIRKMQRQSRYWPFSAAGIKLQS
jgi:hypothetical protein